ncbi:MAG: hypothetical protein ACK5I7_02670 [Anaerotignum sp.]
MIVKRIKWLDMEGLEAAVTIEGDIEEITAFCHPCFYKEGDQVKSPLLANFTPSIYISFNKEYLINKHDSDEFGYDFCGKLYDKEQQVIKVNGIDIKIEDVSIPKL